MGCKKAQGFLERHPKIPVAERIDARKVRYGRSGALKLAHGVTRVIVVRGKSIAIHDMKSNPPDDDTLAAALLGPSGNLRAPAAKIGSTLLVGFNEEAYKKVFG